MHAEEKIVTVSTEKKYIREVAYVTKGGIMDWKPDQCHSSHQHVLTDKRN